MDKIIEKLIEELDAGKNINADKLNAIIRSFNKGKQDHTKHYAKKYLLPYFLEQKDNNTKIYKNWHIKNEIEEKLIALLKVKPKRSASGVATITVITKPWKCGGDCIFCPNDIRMPKSYLSNEPACQRAERNYFDPYLQVQARLKALHEMGHNTDKVELIVLGGTWNDYSHNYQRWFVHELFMALNNGLTNNNVIETREQLYKDLGITNNLEVIKNNTSKIQEEINNQEINYNNAFDKYYKDNITWNKLSKIQESSWDEIYNQHKINQTTKHRCVGLVFETRPAAINLENLIFMRKLGCTKVQIGVQSLDETKMKISDRPTQNKTVQNAFELLREFGFKIHAHFMANLPGSTPKNDKADFEDLVKNKKFKPDEIKLYPCMLVESARLNKMAKNKKWKAYDEDTLVDVLVYDVIKTPPFTRISRMMRDISSTDISQGVKKTNLRQKVEETAELTAKNKGIIIQEIRHREINQDKTNTDNFKLNNIIYQTSNTTEYFIQYITPKNKILGFLRLSLPKSIDQAMIREVHVYGKVANIGDSGTNAQHLGLGSNLIKKAIEIAKDNGYKNINVISAIGTRKYYESRGFDHFSENGLYQQLNIKK